MMQDFSFVSNVFFSEDVTCFFTLHCRWSTVSLPINKKRLKYSLINVFEKHYCYCRVIVAVIIMLV